MLKKIVWFTGLSGSGKTTLANFLYNSLKKKYKVKIIDGDIFRKKNKNKNNFSRKNIYQNNILIIKYLTNIIKKYDYILVAVVSPLLKTRLLAKKKFKNKYYEVYVYCKISTLINRDTKGLYKLAQKKIITNLIGYNSKIKYQKSKYKKIIINTDKSTPKKSINLILNKVK